MRIVVMVAAVLCSIGCGQKECPPAPPCTSLAAPAMMAAKPSAAPITPPAGSPGPDALASTSLSVNPGAGRNNFTAVFDSQVGERITAESSAVGCDATYDAKTDTFSGTCSVPLTSIMVDSNPTKSEHFQQWTTNKKSDPKDCKFEAKFDHVPVSAWLTPGQSAKFAADIPFTVCGRTRTDGGQEHVEGTATLLPPEESGARFLRVRAQIDGFGRDAYHIGPEYTDGWLARVEKLAKVVADKGTINLSLFAKAG